MMKRKFQYKAGERILDEAGDNSRFDLKMPEEIAGKIAHKLFRLWDWKRALREIYAPSGLESLANQWLRTYAMPALAYARVVEISYRGHASKYVRMGERQNGNDMVNL